MGWNDNIKFLRKQNGDSQMELAQALTVSQRTISNWESGDTQPNIEQIKRIAQRYKVSTDYLLNFDFLKKDE